MIVIIHWSTVWKGTTGLLGGEYVSTGGWRSEFSLSGGGWLAVATGSRTVLVNLSVGKCWGVSDICSMLLSSSVMSSVMSRGKRRPKNPILLGKLPWCPLELSWMGVMKLWGASDNWPSSVASLYEGGGEGVLVLTCEHGRFPRSVRSVGDWESLVSSSHTSGTPAHEEQTQFALRISWQALCVCAMVTYSNNALDPARHQQDKLGLAAVRIPSFADVFGLNLTTTSHTLDF